MHIHTNEQQKCQTNKKFYVIQMTKKLHADIFSKPVNFMTLNIFLFLASTGSRKI